MEDKSVEWTFAEESVGKLGLGGSEIPASVFQAVNPIYIMIFGLVLHDPLDLDGDAGLRAKYAGEVRVWIDPVGSRVRDALLRSTRCG